MRRLEFTDDQPPVSPEELAGADTALAELGHRIPDSYREFLAAADGGPPVEDTFEFDEVDGRHQRDRIAFFLGVAESPDGDLVTVAQTLHGRIAPGLLPIAGDEYGNLLLLDGRDNADGAVWFWDHERDSGEPDDSALVEVAPDLATFLDRLVPSR